jgi:hypothetical protein
VINPTLVRAIVLLLASGAVNKSPAFGQAEPDWMAEIRRAWLARQETIQTLELEIQSEKRIRSLGQVIQRLTGTPLVGNKDSGSEKDFSKKLLEFELSFSGDKFSLRWKEVEVDGRATPDGARARRDTFDGERSWHYSGTSDGGKVGSGVIESTAYSTGADLLDIRPVILACRPLNVALAKLDLSKCSLRGKSEMVDGRACWYIEDAVTQAGVGKSYGIWLDPNRDFHPLRFQSKVNGRESYRIDITPRKHERIGWIPDQWHVTWVNSKTGDLKGSFKCRVTRVAVNETIPDSEFVIAFPAETDVEDRVTGTSYVQEASSSFQTWLVLILVIAVAVTIGTAFWSRVHRQTRLDSVKGVPVD